MNLVVGATGLLGSEICGRLAVKSKPVKALVRSTSDQAKVDKLRGLGAELVQGDLRDRASLEAACQGVTAVISTASSMPFSYQPEENNIQTVDLGGLTNLIAAAQLRVCPRCLCQLRLCDDPSASVSPGLQLLLA